jgi:hypothetical protein
MKITNKQLKQIIKEELAEAMGMDYASDENMSRREELGHIASMPTEQLIQALDAIKADTLEMGQVIEMLDSNTDGEKIKAIAMHILKFDPQDNQAQGVMGTRVPTGL